MGAQILTGRRQITTDNWDGAILAHWRAGLDTFEIARELMIHESVVANRLMHLRNAGGTYAKS